MKDYMDRVDRLREKAVEPTVTREEFYYRFYTRFAENAALGEDEARFADALYYAFDRVETPIPEDALLVGRSEKILEGAEKEAWERLKETVVPGFQTLMGQDSHMTVDFERVLTIGTEGIRKRAERMKAEKPEKAVFYDAVITSLLGVEIYAAHYAAEARRLADGTEGKRKKELLTIAEVMDQVPQKPARSFYEAVECIHFIAHVLSFAPQRVGSTQQFQLGRPDRLLISYYENDLAAGKITPDEAQELFDLLAIEINHRVHHGLSSGYMLGGRDKSGKIVCNAVTEMGLQAIDDVHLVYPSVGLCVTDGMPEEILKKACAILSRGRSHPAFFNDDVIRAGLEGYGVPADEACDYIHSTCVEITPIGSSNVWVASPYTNLPGLLLECMDREYPDFEALLKVYFEKLDASIARNFEEQNNFRRVRTARSVHPLLSAFVKDCLEEGVDIEKGGARYNWIMPSFVGMANLVDGLTVLKKMIFEEKRMTMTEYRVILEADFAGNEALRERVLSAYPKYGNDIDEVDALFPTVQGHIVETCKKFTPMHKNARLIPSVFCWIMHERFGHETGATPDGRRACFPLGDGSGPCQGREKAGPTASVLSSTKWPHKEMIGGVAVNMKFGKSTFTAEGCEKILALVRTYLARGGFEMQINVVDRETLLAAQKEPEKYKDLVVRIGGYSDYFTRISPEMQAEVLARSEHEA